MLAASIRRLGGSLFADPLDLGTGNQYAYARDREDNIIEIEGLPYAPADQSTWIGHVALVTSDLDRLIDFYHAILGTELQSRAMVGPGPESDKMGGLQDARLEGAWLSANNMLFEFWQFHAPSSPPAQQEPRMGDTGYTHVCLESDDLDRDFDLMIRAGAIPMSDPLNSGNARMQLARDPDGNILQLLEAGDQYHHPIGALEDTGVCNRIDALR